VNQASAKKITAPDASPSFHQEERAGELRPFISFRSAGQQGFVARPSLFPCTNQAKSSQIKPEPKYPNADGIGGFSRTSRFTFHASPDQAKSSQIKPGTKYFARA